MPRILFKFTLTIIAAAAVFMPGGAVAQTQIASTRSDHSPQHTDATSLIRGPADGGASGPRSGSITGTVRNDAALSDRVQVTYANGVPGVRVILRPADITSPESAAVSRSSDSGGAFEFTGLAPGRYILETDPASLPDGFRVSHEPVGPIYVAAFGHSYVEVPVAAQRTLTGIVFIDRNGDGRFKPRNDTPVKGATITLGSLRSTSDAEGRYILTGLPPGRVEISITLPGRPGNTNALLELASGPVRDRFLNIALSP